jgi:hypothetical protein
MKYLKLFEYYSKFWTFIKGDYTIKIYASNEDEAQEQWEELKQRNYFPTSGIAKLTPNGKWKYS